jgi:hypothetical protein
MHGGQARASEEAVTRRAKSSLSISLSLCMRQAGISLDCPRVITKTFTDWTEAQGEIFLVNVRNSCEGNQITCSLAAHIRIYI